MGKFIPAIHQKRAKHQLKRKQSIRSQAKSLQNPFSFIYIYIFTWQRLPNPPRKGEVSLSKPSHFMRVFLVQFFHKHCICLFINITMQRQIRFCSLTFDWAHISTSDHCLTYLITLSLRKQSAQLAFPSLRGKGTVEIRKTLILPQTPSKISILRSQPIWVFT